ncbi:GNAT family N-acetyltransferase [Paraflavitalea speifideaquila]|uniref:GNAT family N-acetyltransferase n=1 Tax=Paraflavitalea speifideaquila TaxID=3076558 RepID=UPI0028E1B20C|nr:GNAT family N-acetyltransferase [Paraflavitalea speifideiaquila]
MQINQATREHHPILIDIWEASVRATHHFLTNEDILYFRQRIPEQYFNLVDLYYISNEQQEITGLLGLSPGKIEMLFIHPRHFRKGYGNLLTGYAIRQHQVNQVDVNEQNPQAVAFYLRQGFRIINRLEKDNEGKDFPILQMEL